MIRLIFSVYIICIFSGSSAFASIELEKINAKAKDRYVTPDALDRFMIDLREVENNPGMNQLDDSLLLDTYKAISNSYSRNNHYKQAYQVMNKYILLKEGLLVRSNSSAIKNAQDLFRFRDQKDFDREKLLQDSLLQITKDKIGLTIKITSFKRNFSFVLIILSSIFAILLVGAGIRLLNLRSKTLHNRNRIKKIHRRANIGYLQQGINSFIQSSFLLLKTQTKELIAAYKSQEGKLQSDKSVKQSISSIEKLFD